MANMTELEQLTKCIKEIDNTAFDSHKQDLNPTDTKLDSVNIYPELEPEEDKNKQDTDKQVFLKAHSSTEDLIDVDTEVNITISESNNEKQKTTLSLNTNWSATTHPEQIDIDTFDITTYDLKSPKECIKVFEKLHMLVKLQTQQIVELNDRRLKTMSMIGKVHDAYKKSTSGRK